MDASCKVIDTQRSGVVTLQLKAHGMTALSKTQDLTLDIIQKILERAV